MAQPTGSLSLGYALRIAFSLSAGVLGSAVLLLLLFLVARLGWTPGLWGIEDAHHVYGISAILSLGALWGLLFSPFLAGALVNPWLQGTMVALVPLFVDGLILLPVVREAGVFGLTNGLGFAGAVVLFNLVWGLVGAGWNRLCLVQLLEARKD